MRRALAAGLVGVLIVVASAAGAQNVEDRAPGFIEALADKAVQALTVKGIARPERIERFRRLFREHFAVRAIAVWILGRHWRTATPQEQEEYLVLFEDLIVASYVDRFAEYTGETLQIVKTAPVDESTAIVFAEFVRPVGGPPVRVDWRVAGTNGDLKIVDVIVEGTSMSGTLRSDFASIIRQKGGTVAGLLDELRAKTRELRPNAGG